jgi:hypothetical protein
MVANNSRIATGQLPSSLACCGLPPLNQAVSPHKTAQNNPSEWRGRTIKQPSDLIDGNLTLPQTPVDPGDLDWAPQQCVRLNPKSIAKLLSLLE